MRRPLFVAWLVLAWVLLWGRLSWANVLSGLLVVGVLLGVVPIGGPRRRPVVRPVALARLVGQFVVQLVLANVTLTRTILARHDRLLTGVVAVPLDDVSDGVLTVVMGHVALTPGTLTVEVQRDPTVLYIHVIALRSREDVVRELHDIQRRAEAAFGAEGARGDRGPQW
jgi:multicomponent Na+:H+ antiporter subunit E